MKKRIIVFGIVAALTVGVLGAWSTLTQLSLADDRSASEAVTIERGTVISAVKATARLEPRQEIALGFEINGVVADVLVERGESVDAGDPLVRLNTTDLELAVAQAEVELERAETELAQVITGVDADDLASARAALASAQASYDTLLEGSSEDELIVAVADLRKAEIELQKAQWEYDKVAYKDGVGASAEAAALEQATITHAAALASHNLAVEGASEDELKAAESEIAQSQAALNNLLQGASAEDIALAESSVKAAQLSLACAERDLERATLLAPCDGIVTEVNVAAGECPGTAAVILLADLSVLHIDLPVDEIDLPTVEMGQPAIITLDALPDSPLAGRVTAIAPAPVLAEGGVTTYEVTVALEDENEQAKMGMTANVAIETDRRDEVVVIPVRLIQVDGATGQIYLERLTTDGQAVKTPVTLGMRSGQHIEVLSGLEAGDRVLVPPPPDMAQTEAGIMGSMGSSRDDLIDRLE